MTVVIPAAADTSSLPTISPLGVELGARYELVGPDGTRAVFNDPTDAAFVGYLTDLSGLDSPEVRDNVDVRAADDGARHGSFYLGRRTLSFQGLIGSPDATTRNAMISRLQRATNALRGDAILRWQTTGGLPVEIRVRRQDPLRISGLASKTFQIGLASADPRVYAQEYNAFASGSTAYGVTAWSSSTSYTTGNLVRYGNQTWVALGAVPTNTTPAEGTYWTLYVRSTYPGLKPSTRVATGWDALVLVGTVGTISTPPVVTLRGPLSILGSGVGWRVYNATTDTAVESVASSTANIPAGEYVVLDYEARTATHNSGASWYSRLNFVQTDWDGLAPGTNDLRFYGLSTSAATGYRLEWRDAWV